MPLSQKGRDPKYMPVDVRDLDFTDISGVISDAQHGTKTTIPDAHHREWNWADEESWIKTIGLPFLPSNQKTSEYVFTTAYGVDVLYYDGKVYIYYRAGSPTEIYVRSSSDFVNFGPAKKVLSAGTGWEASLSEPHVFYDAYMTGPDKFRMYYRGSPLAEYANYVGLAYCSTPDGTFTKSPSNPLTIPDKFRYSGLTVFRFGDVLYGVYKYNLGDKTIHVALSSDGVNWSHWGEILALGSAGEWDDYILGAPISLFWNLGVWYILYAGRRSDTNFKIGMATSYSGFRLFDRYPLNPIIETYTTGNVFYGTLLKHERGFHIYYWEYGGYIRHIEIPSKMLT